MKNLTAVEENNFLDITTQQEFGRLTAENLYIYV